MKKDFVKNDWDHMHDCILDATYNSIKLNLSQEQMEELFDLLPEGMQHDAFKYGMNDTVFREL